MPNKNGIRRPAWGCKRVLIIKIKYSWSGYNSIALHHPKFDVGIPAIFSNGYE
jgi:hypothetical protein